jgi:hypothetical protein
MDSTHARVDQWLTQTLETQPNPATLNARLLLLDRAWLADRSGLPRRAWFRNHLVCTDETSGYGAWMLPAYTAAVKYDSAIEREAALDAYKRIIQMTDALLSPPTPPR